MDLDSRPFSEYVDFFLKEIESTTFCIYRQRSIFVFGGPYQSDDNRSFREEFYKKTDQLDNEDNYIFLYAESLFENLALFNDEYQYINVALIERISGYIVDAIIIIPESVGSYCEIGYFAHSEYLKKKILVANNYKYNESPSFLKRGIIDLINGSSLYRGDIIALNDEECNLEKFNTALRRIQSSLNKSQRKIFHSNTYLTKNKKVEGLDLNLFYRFRYIIFFEIILFFRFISFRQIKVVFKKIFGSYERDELEVYAAFLLTIGFIETPEDDPEILRSRVSESFLGNEKKDAKFSMKKLELERLHREMKSEPYLRFNAD